MVSSLSWITRSKNLCILLSLLLSWLFSSVQLLSHVWLFATPMDCSTPGFPVHHQLLELSQTHVHQVGDAIQPSHPLSSPCPPAFNLSQHQGLFWWVSFLHQVATVPGLISFRIDWFDLPVVQGTLRVFDTTLQKHQVFSAQLSLWSDSHIHTWLLEKTIALTRQIFVGKVTSVF